MEKSLDIPVSKFMDRENTNKEKAYANYIEVICKPLFATYLILTPEKDSEVKKEVMDALTQNKKNLDNRIDSEAGK